MNLYFVIMAIFIPILSARESRFLDGSVLSRIQLDANYKGSASIILTLSTDACGKPYFHVGALFSKEKILVHHDSDLKISNIFVSELVRPASSPADKDKVCKTIELSTTIPRATTLQYDGEEYPVADSTNIPFGPTALNLRTIQFGPISTGSKGVVATLPPAGSTPPKPGTKGCIAYSYGPVSEGDVDPSHYKLNYTPLTIIDPSNCTGIDKDNAFCGIVSTSDGKGAACSAIDTYLIAFCPSTSLRKQFADSESGEIMENNSKQENKILCLFSWWWWCSVEPTYILTGMRVSGDSTNCGLPNPNNRQYQNVYSFIYTANYQ